jgi:hypothetical protein
VKHLREEQLVNHLSTLKANWITANLESLWESITTPALRSRWLKAAKRTPDEVAERSAYQLEHEKLPACPEMMAILREDFFVADSDLPPAEWLSLQSDAIGVRLGFELGPRMGGLSLVRDGGRYTLLLEHISAVVGVGDRDEEGDYLAGRKSLVGAEIGRFYEKFGSSTRIVRVNVQLLATKVGPQSHVIERKSKLESDLIDDIVYFIFKSDNLNFLPFLTRRAKVHPMAKAVSERTSTTQTLTAMLRRAVRKLGLGEMAGHFTMGSLRKGCATSISSAELAKQVGAEELAAMQGKWKDTGVMRKYYLVYRRMASGNGGVRGPLSCTEGRGEKEAKALTVFTKDRYAKPSTVEEIEELIPN